VQSKVFTFTMFFLTIWVLFGDDIRLAYCTLEADPIFNAITLAAITLFTVELLLTSVSQDDYVGSFFFWLDIIATVSLILDLTFVWEYLVGYDDISSTKGTGTGNEAANQSDLARAGRSSRVGTRVARLLRVFRLIRVSSMSKRFSVWRSRNKRSTYLDYGRRPGSSTEDDGKAEGVLANASGTGSESRVGRMLSARTTLRVIVLVLAMLIVIPLLSPGQEDTMLDSSAQYGADAIYQAWRDFMLEASRESRTNVSLTQRRRAWEMQVLLYVYYHNYYAECPLGVVGSCAADHLFKLCWLGYVGAPGDTAASDGYISELEASSWDSYFQGGGDDWTQMQYIVGTIPSDIKDRLSQPWKTECAVSTSNPDQKVVGVSLLRRDDCPWLNLRPQEATSYRPRLLQQLPGEPAGDGRMVLIFDIHERTITEAIMSMIRTVFIVFVLAVGAFKFSADADNLVLHPIERMISKVEHIRRDPLYAIKLGDEQYRLQHLQEQAVRRRGFCRTLCSCSGLWGSSDTSTQKRQRRRMSVQAAAKSVTLETKILENTIIKLGSLLALGFGEAGSEIIGQNLDDDNVMVDAMIPGSKVEGVYGYCQIQDFTMTTEVLQQKTMVFVNQVAEIVHNIVDEHLGAANKNLGEAFLLVWRVGLYEERQRPKIADLSVMSFVQVLAAVNRDRQLAAYREHPALQARKSNYRVSLGFGLHLGWSIEGAIGSEFKIDASYLSSHVNLAVYLESVARQYGVKLLISEALARTCSRRMACLLRGIDNVRLPGAKTPTRLFTVDLDVQALETDLDTRKQNKAANRFQEPGVPFST
jgi:class 3 adenylate cyclase